MESRAAVFCQPGWCSSPQEYTHFPALTVCPWEVSVLAQGCVWAPYPCLSAGLRPLTGPLLPLRHERPPLWPAQTIRLTPNPLVNRLPSHHCFLQSMTKFRAPEVCLNHDFTGSSTLWNSYISYETAHQKNLQCLCCSLLQSICTSNTSKCQEALRTASCHQNSSTSIPLPVHQWDSKSRMKKRQKFFVNFKKSLSTQIRIYSALVEEKIFA